MKLSKVTKEEQRAREKRAQRSHTLAALKVVAPLARKSGMDRMRLRTLLDATMTAAARVEQAWRDEGMVDERMPAGLRMQVLQACAGLVSQIADAPDATREIGALVEDLVAWTRAEPDDLMSEPAFRSAGASVDERLAVAGMRTRVMMTALRTGRDEDDGHRMSNYVMARASRLAEAVTLDEQGAHEDGYRIARQAMMRHVSSALLTALEMNPDAELRDIMHRADDWLLVIHNEVAELDPAVIDEILAEQEAVEEAAESWGVTL